jgi:transposase-like protein
MDTTDPRREEARRLRIDPGLSRAQLMRHFGVGNGTLTEWLRGLPAPAWTRRPNAKDSLRDRAVALRREGGTVPEIAVALGVAKSTAYLWTRDLPLDRTPAEQGEHRARLREARSAARRGERDVARAATVEQLSAWVGDLSRRETVLVGAIAYWCAGARQKPWHKGNRGLEYLNSDPGLVDVFLRYVEVLGVARSALTYRLSIHETADIAAATRWWAAAVGAPVERFRRPILKTHNPSTARRRGGATYRGCLIIYVPRSARLSWEVEGVVRGIVTSAGGGRAASM